MQGSVWDSSIVEYIEGLSPREFRKYLDAIGTVDLDDDLLAETAELFLAEPMSLMVASMFGKLFLDADAQASMADTEQQLSRLWQAVIDERETIGLSPRAAEEDDALVDQLEFMRTAMEGLCAILRSYAGGEATAEQDANELILEALQAAASDLARARQLFGRAGAAAIQGGPYWPLWHLEIEVLPAEAWAAALDALDDFLTFNNLHPCQPLEGQRAIMARKREQAAIKPVGEPINDSAPVAGKLTPDIQRLMDVLLCGKEKLNDKQTKSLPPLTPEVVEQLIYVLEAEEYAAEESTGKGWAPIHAARLLGQSGSVKAVQPLIQTTYNNNYETIVHSAALFALGDLGPAALPMLLDSMQYSTDMEFKGSLASALAKAGRGDDRAFRALEAFYYASSWDGERMVPMMSLADLADPRVKDIFYKSLKSDRDIKPEGIRGIVGALEELDPANAEELHRLSEHALRRYDSLYVRFDSKGQAFCRDCGGLMRRGLMGEWEHEEPEEPPALPARSRLREPARPDFDARFAKVGRNDPCPCGSGKKFKHCHGANKPTVH